MAVSPADIKKLAPELASETNSRIQFFIDMATKRVNANVWGDDTDQGIQTLTAHFMTVAGRGGNSGPVTSEKVGDLARAYGSLGTDHTELNSTSYGSMFVTFMKALPISPRVTGCL